MEQLILLLLQVQVLMELIYMQKVLFGDKLLLEGNFTTYTGLLLFIL
jgi:hypothetical protein